MKHVSHIMVLLLAAVMIGFAGDVLADGKPAFAGTKSCKMCHKKEKTGNQYGKWSDGPHAKAYTSLASEEAKAVGKKAGVEDPQKSGKCLKCHSTTYNNTEEVKTEKVKPEEGVTCESCHGPGKKYKSKKVMQDHDASVKAGMIYPAKDNCTKCHNDSSPTWNAERYTTKDGKKVGFDADQAYDKIKHPNPEKDK